MRHTYLQYQIDFLAKLVKQVAVNRIMGIQPKWGLQVAHITWGHIHVTFEKIYYVYQHSLVNHIWAKGGYCINTMNPLAQKENFQATRAMDRDARFL